MFIEVNKERSGEKIASAKMAIRKMAEDRERISVPRLIAMTGLSRGFFYKDPEVRAEIDRAMERQAIKKVWQRAWAIRKHSPNMTCAK